MDTQSDSDRDESANVFFGTNNQSDSESDTSKPSDSVDENGEKPTNYFTNHHFQDEF